MRARSTDCARWTCSRHRSGYDPRPGYRDELMLRAVCHSRRLGQVDSIVRYHGEVDRDLRRIGRRYQDELMARGYLDVTTTCPDADGDNVAKTCPDSNNVATTEG